MNGLEYRGALRIPLLQALGQLIHPFGIILHFIDGVDQDILYPLWLFLLAGMNRSTWAHILYIRHSLLPRIRHQFQCLIHLILNLLSQDFKIEEHHNTLTYIFHIPLRVILVMRQIFNSFIEPFGGVPDELLFDIIDLNLNLFNCLQLNYTLLNFGPLLANLPTMTNAFRG